MNNEPLLSFLFFSHGYLVRAPTMFIMTRSQSDTKQLRRSLATITIVVESMSSRYFLTPCSFGSQGQVAFWSSAFTSLKNVETFADMR
jgi:hypothetical protein